ncbi:MAG: hypothetical protein PVI26_01075 [Chitinispirillia bacterium]|jgi:hypothetical protein
MKIKILEHIFSLFFVSIIMISILVIINHNNRRSEETRYSQINEFINLSFFDLNNSFHKALFKDILLIYYPDQYDRNQEIIKALEQYREDKLNESIQKSYLQEKLSWPKFFQILGMYIKFLIVYIIVMVLTYYGVQTFGVWRFIQKKQKYEILKNFRNYSPGKKVVKLLRNTMKGIAYFILFSPAYVIAYSIRTEFNTDTLFFMILLGVISNGLLVVYANKFYTFLIAESRKGYVETALVKNLNSVYSNKDEKQGIPLGAIFKPVKLFKGHVFQHIFQNARFQYFSTIKEQASFLITGLIIIEMALNIHGHLSYEMLRQILYKNFDIVIIIILGIFYTVKFTEIFSDFIILRETRKFENEMYYEKTF